MKKIAFYNRYHFLNIINKIFIVNINREYINDNFVKLMRTPEFKHIFMIFDENFKTNLVKYLRKK
jgi:hypothetical protein